MVVVRDTTFQTFIECKTSINGNNCALLAGGYLSIITDWCHTTSRYLLVSLVAFAHYPQQVSFCFLESLEFFYEMSNNENLSKDSIHFGFLFLCHVTGAYDGCTISLTCNTRGLSWAYTPSHVPEYSSKHCS